MKFEDVLKACANGEMPKVSDGRNTGTVTTIKNTSTTRGISVDFGRPWEDWFWDEEKTHYKRRVMSELKLI